METVCCHSLWTREAPAMDTLCPLLWMEFMCTLGKTLFYIIYITGIVELPNINVPYTLRVSFTQMNSFVSGETEALVITIPLIYSMFKYTGLEAARGKQAFNKYKCCEIASRHSSLTQYRWFSSSFSPKSLFLHTTASISPFSNRSGSITVSWLASNSTMPTCVSSSLKLL